MTATATHRDASLTVYGHAKGTDFEVELFGPVEMPDGSQRIGHCYRRFVSSIEVASTAIRSWLDGDLEPVGFEAEAVSS